MTSIRLLVALCIGMVGSGCASHTPASERLSMDDRAAYLIILDQLNQLPGRAEAQTQHFNLCVRVSSSQAGNQQMDDLFLQDLRTEMPAGLSATLMLESDCIEQDGLEPYTFQDGTPAWEAFVHRRPRIMDDGDQWAGGVSCGESCGWGNFYRINFDLGRMSVARTADLSTKNGRLFWSRPRG